MIHRDPLALRTFRNPGVGLGGTTLDLGRHAVTAKDADKRKLKTPSLRGVAHTAPYMHDGSVKTLEDVVEFYKKGGVANPNLDSKMVPLNLSRDDIARLVAFLKAL